MNVEVILTEELRAVAGSVQPPPAPIAELVRRAEQSRTRTRAGRVAAIGLVAAAVVGAVVIGSQIGRPTASPPPTHPSQTPTGGPLPVGDAPRIAYVVRDTLYVNGTTQTGSFAGVQNAGGSAVAYRLDGGADGTPIVFRAGRRDVVLSGAVGGTRLSPDGTMVAWFEVSDGADQLVLRDLTTGHDLGRVAVDATAVNVDDQGNLNVVSITADGTVVYTADAAAYFSWRPGGTPVGVPAPDPEAAPGGFSPDASFVTLNRDETWGVWATDRLGHAPESPDFTGVTDGATFEKRGDPESRFTVTFPDGGGAYGLQWESETYALLDYLVDGEGSNDRYLRCSVVTQRCEYAPTPANP
jgi:hypothetical protein